MEQAIGTTASQIGNSPQASAEQAAPAQMPARGRDDSDAGNEGYAGKRLYAGREWSVGHPLNIRLSIPIGFGRYYVALVAGKERRARARLALDRHRNPLDTPGNVLFLAFVVTIATAGSATLAYLFMAHVFGWSGRLFL